VGIIASPNSGKTELMIHVLKNMIDQRNNDCFVFFFSTTLGSQVNSARFEKLQKELKCNIIVYEKIPDLNSNDMKTWFLKQVST
jgi:hypothetical protein